MNCSKKASVTKGLCDAGSCLGFDIRQCNEDVFSSAVNSSGSVEERTAQMTTWLLERSVDVNVKLVENYYEGVCEACYICPEPHRYFVQVKEGSSKEAIKTKLEELELFNLLVEDCVNVFCF